MMQVFKIRQKNRSRFPRCARFRETIAKSFPSLPDGPLSSRLGPEPLIYIYIYIEGFGSSFANLSQNICSVWGGAHSSLVVSKACISSSPRRRWRRGGRRLFVGQHRSLEFLKLSSEGYSEGTRCTASKPRWLTSGNMGLCCQLP